MLSRSIPADAAAAAAAEAAPPLPDGRCQQSVTFEGTMEASQLSFETDLFFVREKGVQLVKCKCNPSPLIRVKVPLLSGHPQHCRDFDSEGTRYKSRELHILVIRVISKGRGPALSVAVQNLGIYHSLQLP